MTNKIFSQYKDGSGLCDPPDSRNIIYEDCFGSAPQEDIKPIGRMEAILDSPLAHKDNILKQMNLLSCVPLHISMLNQQHSWFNSESLIKPSWAMWYALLGFAPGKGTSVNECLKLSRDVGQCLDKNFSQNDAIYKYGEKGIHNKNFITDEMREEGKHWKMGKSSRLTDLSRNSIHSALKHGPVIAGVFLNDNWNDEVIVSKTRAMNHLTLINDIDKDWNYDLQEGFLDDALDVRKLSPDSYIGLAISVRDIPDDLIIKAKEKRIMKILMCTNHPKEDERVKIYVLDFSNRLHHFCEEDTYEEYVSSSKDFSIVQDIDYEMFKSYDIGRPISMYGQSLIDIIKFWAKNKKISLD